MPTFKLPKGYSFEPPPGVDVQSIGVPDKGYGGADISQQFDATGIHYVACNAWGPGEPSFRWRAFKRVAAAYVEVPLPFIATGRGEHDVQWYDGRDWGIAWTADQFQFDIIPSFVPFPSIPALDARIKALEAGIVVPPPGSTGGITLAPAPITSPAWEGRTLEGGVVVDVPAVFGVIPADSYLIRFVAQAGAANIRVRAGTQAAPFFLTMNLAVANMQQHIQGWAPGPNMYVSTVNGAATIWLQVVGLP